MLQQKLITVKEIIPIFKKGTQDQIGAKLVDEDGVKYSFFKSKTDGSSTKAYLGFKSQGIKPGDSIAMMISSELQEWTNAEGKKVETWNNKICYFNDLNEINQLEKEVKEESNFNKMIDEFDEDKEIDVSRIPF